MEHKFYFHETDPKNLRPGIYTMSDAVNDAFIKASVDTPLLEMEFDVDAEMNVVITVTNKYYDLSENYLTIMGLWFQGVLY